MKTLKRIFYFTKPAYYWMSKHYYRLLTCISPRLNAISRYRQKYGIKPNLDNPISFVEKLMRIKLIRYNSDPLVKLCADKYLVRDYITQKGYSQILVPVIGIAKDVDEINWASLPEKFVVKWNFGTGLNLICFNKASLDIKKAKATLKKWKNDKSYLDYAELQYKVKEKVMLIEHFLPGLKEGMLPSDYKVYCFKGVPKAILFIDGRGTDEKTAAFFSTDWRYLGQPKGKEDSYHAFNLKVDPPTCLEDMVAISQELAKPFGFVRVDFYVVDNHLFFSEMTFTPAGILHASTCDIDGVDMGNLLD